MRERQVPGRRAEDTLQQDPAAALLKFRCSLCVQCSWRETIARWVTLPTISARSGLAMFGEPRCGTEALDILNEA